MGRYVWVSDAQADPELILPFEADLAEKDPHRAAEASRALRCGWPLAPDMVAYELWASDSASTLRELPNLFYSYGHWIVSAAAAAVLARFKLGWGGLHPVRLLQNDRRTPIPGEFMVWSFGSVKMALEPSRSRVLRPFGTAGSRWKMPYAMSHHAVAVGPSATEGPDVWIDPQLFMAIFLSQALGDALEEAGLRRDFRLYQAPVV